MNFDQKIALIVELIVKKKMFLKVTGSEFLLDIMTIIWLKTAHVH